MKQVTKLALALVMTAGLSACGGDLADKLGADFSSTDTGFEGSIQNEHMSIGGIRLDIIGL